MKEEEFESEDQQSVLFLLQEIEVECTPTIRNYKNIYIREDYSCTEREEIKKYVDEAKKRNENREPEIRWHVKGCPRSRLYLEKRKNPRKEDQR